MGHDIFVDYFFCNLISQKAFKSATNLDSDLMLVRGNYQKRAIIFLARPYAPMISQISTIFLDAVASQRKHRHHYDLIGVSVFEDFEFSGEFPFIVFGQQSRFINDPAGQVRE